VRGPRRGAGEWYGEGASYLGLHLVYLYCWKTRVLLILSFGIGCLLVVLLLVWAFKAGRQRADAAVPMPAPVQGAPRAVPRPEAPAAPPAAAPVRAAAKAPERVVPAQLQALHLARFPELAPARVDALAARLQSIPRPPHALDKLVSAQFLSQASSAELNDLMVGEPQIAAKVLAAVNSPLYGLQKPLGSIGQAATYLGMNSVRQICMQYMLDASFKPTSPAVKVCYEQVWNASALSGALCFKLAQLLKLPDPGGLVTQIVLSSLGPLATFALLEPEAVLRLAGLDPIARAQAEQEALGLCAAEVGGLLLQSWKLPPSLIEDICDIDRILSHPAQGPADARQARLGLCYLCKCIADRMVAGSLTDLRQFDVGQMEDAAMFHLAAYLHNFRLERLPEFLQFPEVLAAADQMASGIRLARPPAG